jgi:hypothetical protein
MVRRDWVKFAARIAVALAIVVGFGVTPGCICRSRTYPGRVVVTPAPRVVVTQPVRVAPAPVRPTGVRVGVGAPVRR